MAAAGARALSPPRAGSRSRAGTEAAVAAVAAAEAAAEAAEAARGEGREEGGWGGGWTGLGGRSGRSRCLSASDGAGGDAGCSSPPRR